MLFAVWSSNEIKAAQYDVIFKFPLSESKCKSSDVKFSIAEEFSRDIWKICKFKANLVV